MSEEVEHPRLQGQAKEEPKSIGKKIFISYAHKDEALRKRLDTHLSLLRRQGLIASWHDRHIRAGIDWAEEIDQQLDEAAVILLLISADFVASDYCYGREMKRALERHEVGQARVIPIILRPVDWKSAPFAHLQCLPTTEKPVTMWTNLDEAFRVIATGIRDAIGQLLSPNAIIQPPSKTSTTILPYTITDVRELLEAMGYRVTDVRVSGTDLYLLCDIKWGADIYQEVVHFVEREPRVDDVASLSDVVATYNAIRGILLTRQSLPTALQDLFRQRKHLQCYTLDEFTDHLADFRPYLLELIGNYQASEIPQYYVPLTVQRVENGEQQHRLFSPLVPFLDSWLTEPARNHISLLGDFGSGKTWLCRHYAYLAAKRYLASPDGNRVPIFIPLRDYSRAYNIEQLITDVMINRYGISLAAGYKTFARLNDAGRLLLIFDGFDEMEQRISDYRTTIDNFWELSKIVVPKSKILLTCRTAYFRNQAEEETTLTPRQSQILWIAKDQVIDLQDHKGFEVAHLQGFTDEDIQLALQKRLPSSWEQVFEQIQGLVNLYDLASRPVLLDMLTKTLPHIHDAEQINLATVYETYVNTLLRRRWGENTDYISPPERLLFIQELAWAMYQTQRLAISFSEFPQRVVEHYRLKDSPERATFFERDIRTQSYLVRDGAGNYRFAHRSFLEYFVARKMASSIAETGNDITQTIKIWKTAPLTPEVRDFLVHMISGSDTLWRLIEATRNKTEAEAGYAGGNAATLLRRQGASVAKADLAATVLIGADLNNCDLTETNLRGANLRHSNLKGCTLVRTDLRDADLTEVSVGEMGEVEAVMFDPSGEFIASGSADGIVRLWRWVTGDQVQHFLGGTTITSVCFSEDGQWILAGVDQSGHINMWSRKSTDLVRTFIGHTGPVWDISLCPKLPRFASCAHDGSVRIWDIKLGTQVNVIRTKGRGIWDVCYSPDGAYITVAGGSELGIYDVKTGESIWTAPEQTPEFRSVRYSTSNLLAYTTYEGTLFVRDAGSKELVLTMKTASIGPNGIAFDPEGRMLAVGCSGPDAKLQIWNIPTGAMIAEGSFDSQGYIGRIHWGSNKRLVSGSSDGIICIWDVDPDSSTCGRCLKQLKAVMNCQGMLIEGAKGLYTRTANSEGKVSLRNWFIARGASVSEIGN